MGIALSPQKRLYLSAERCGKMAIFWRDREAAGTRCFWGLPLL
jgi:hypothetical protein